MKLELVAVVVFFLTIAGSNAFKWKDCGKNPDRAIHFKELLLLPSPLKGNAHNTAIFRATISRDLNKFSMKMSLKKKVLFVKIPAPCINGLGSCTYENVCDQMWADKECPADVQAAGVPCQCPIKAGEIGNADGVKFFIPNFGKIVSALASGEYYFHAVLNDIDSGEELGCLDLTVQLDA